MNDPSRYRIDEKTSASDSESASDLDEAAAKLETIHEGVKEVGSRLVAPVPGMGSIAKGVVDFLEEFATLGLLRKDDDEKCDD